MKATDYTSCLICGWMVRKYSLTGISLIVFAILYSTSQGCFFCTVNWDFIELCTCLNRKEADLILQSFNERGIIKYDGVHYMTIDSEGNYGEG